MFISTQPCSKLGSRYQDFWTGGMYAFTNFSTKRGIPTHMAIIKVLYIGVKLIRWFIIVLDGCLASLGFLTLKLFLICSIVCNTSRTNNFVGESDHQVCICRFSSKQLVIILIWTSQTGHSSLLVYQYINDGYNMFTH